MHTLSQVGWRIPAPLLHGGSTRVFTKSPFARCRNSKLYNALAKECGGDVTDARLNTALKHEKGPKALDRFGALVKSCDAINDLHVRDSD